MELNLKNVKESFSDKLDTHHRLYDKDDLDPEELIQSRLNLIQDAKKAHKAQDSASAVCWYGTCLVKGDEGFPVNYKMGVKFLKEAVMMRSIDADNVLGDLYSGIIGTLPVEKIDFDKAIKYYEKSSKSNSGYADFRLAEIYSGYPPEYKDIRKALDSIDLSCARGDFDGMVLKAMWMYNGELFTKDFNIILDLINQVLDMTEGKNESALARSRALYLMGYIIFYGDVDEPNEAEGIAMIEEAARMGDVSAGLWLDEYDAFKATPGNASS